MNGRIAKLFLGSLVLIPAASNGLAGREMKPPGAMFVTKITGVEGSRPFRHGSHLLVTIEMPRNVDLSSFNFSSMTTVPTVDFTSSSDNSKAASWEVYAQRPSPTGKKLFLELIAKHPDGARPLDATYQPNGTGTILITTTDNTGTMTYTTILVECIETPPAP